MRARIAGFGVSVLLSIEHEKNYRGCEKYRRNGDHGKCKDFPKHAITFRPLTVIFKIFLEIRLWLFRLGYLFQLGFIFFAVGQTPLPDKSRLYL